MRECPEFTTLLRWRDAGEVGRIDAHLAGCADCAQAWASLAALSALGQQMPAELPAPRQVESVRTQLLAQAGAAPARRSPAWIAVAAALVLGLATWTLWPPARAPVASIEGATADYAVRHEAGVERVALRDGRISIEVAHLPADQRFVVQTADAEIEVRGTRFSVSAEAGRLQRVEVVDGRVEVRRVGHETLTLEAAQSWEASAPPPVAPPTSAPATASPTRVQQPESTAQRPSSTPARSAPKRVPGARTRAPETVEPKPVAAASTPARSPQTEQFEAGWRALRAGDFDEAAGAFSAAARLRGSLAADARWWHIVALGRAGHDAQTRAALTRFLKSPSVGSRRAEAQVMLGWLHFSAGQIDAAERAFKAGRGAARAKVRSGAEAGLKAIADWRAARPPQ